MSSDSSEENLELIREAANNEFFSSNLYDPNCEKNTVKVNGSTLKQSLRYQHEEDKPILDISPEFQNFVSAQLMKFIDSQIKEVIAPSRSQNVSDDPGGIRLFTTSTNLVSCDENIGSRSSQMKMIKRRKISKKNSKEEEEKCKAAAVSAEWVLSQEAIVGWEPCTKGKLETFSGDEVEVRCIRRVNEDVANKTSFSAEEKKEKKRLKRQKSREKLKRLKPEKNGKVVDEVCP